MIRPLHSPQNEKFKIWRQLSTAKGIRKQGLFFLMGEKLIKEFLSEPQNSLFKIQAEILGPDHKSLLQGQAFDRIPKYQLPSTMFAELDSLGTHFNLLLLSLPEIPQAHWKSPQGLNLVIPLGDPGNLGAALRSAFAFGIKNIVLTEESALPFHPKALKASAGAVLKMNFSKTGPLTQALAEAPRKKSFVLDAKGDNFHKFSWPKDLYLFTGEEGPGLPSYDLQAVSIPTQGVESLNAAVAISLACFVYNHKMKI